MAGIFEALGDRFLKSNYDVCDEIDTTIGGLESKIRLLDSMGSYDNIQKSYVMGQMRIVAANVETQLMGIKDTVDRHLTQARRAEFQPKYDKIQTLIKEIKKRIELFEKENFGSESLLVS